MAACECCAEIYKSNKVRRALFVLLVIVNLGDMLADWLLYHSVTRIGQGLVYGPVSADLVLALLVFATIGSILFPLEVVNSALKTFYNRCLVNVDVASAFVLWMTDVPQITINVIIVACREELVSKFQLAKGAVVIAGCVVRLLTVLVRYCSKKHLKDFQDDSPNARLRMVARLMVLIGIKITCIGSILVFIFSQFHQENGLLILNNSRGRFDNVGIFVDQNVLVPRGNLNSSNWLKICNIQEVMDANQDLVFRFRIENTTGTPRMTVADNAGSHSFTDRRCFRLSLIPDMTVVNALPNSSCADVTNSNSHDSVFRLHHDMPEVSILATSHIFGDISFNDRRSLANTSLSVMDGYGGPVRYFRFQPSLASGPVDVVFDQVNLTDVKDVWKTGYFRCKPSGSLVPNKDPQLVIGDTYFT